MTNRAEAAAEAAGAGVIPGNRSFQYKIPKQKLLGDFCFRGYNLEYMERNDLKKKVAKKCVSAFAILCLMLFLPAGTIMYGEAWGYIAVLFIPMIFVVRYLFKYEPELLDSRMNLKEKLSKQAAIIKLSYVYFGAIVIIAGLDKRYHWSPVPVPVVIMADIIFLAGYLLFFVVLKDNKYASRIIEVQEGQKVITSGPYAVVRHPMYLSALIMHGLAPIALGSYLAFALSPLLVIYLVVRILSEERVLAKELKGYRQYIGKVKYHLIPGIW